jgi:hypothetical protein
LRETMPGMTSFVTFMVALLSTQGKGEVSFESPTYNFHRLTR